MPEIKLDKTVQVAIESVFSRLTDTQLGNAGIPAGDLPVVRSLNDPDSPEMMHFLGRLPEDTSSILLAYVTGSRSQREEIEALLLNERELVPAPGTPQIPALFSCTDTFISLKDLPEEKRAFEELPFEDWMLYLHPDQSALVAKSFSGPARLRGVSGSGKTVVAIHRAKAAARALVSASSAKSVLFLTYNRSLCELVGRLLQRLCTRQEFERIEVATLGKWCQEYIRFRSGQPVTWRDEIVKQTWTSVLERYLPQLHQANFCMDIATTSAAFKMDPDVQFLSEEIDFIYGKFLHRDADSYLTVERLGRGRRLGPNQRTLILEMYKNLVSGLWAVRQFDAREQARIACSLLEKGEQPKTDYAAVVVDEIQDLSDIELRIVKAIGESAGNLFLVGDGAQQIYKRGQSLKSIGINVSGRAFILRKNYRNTTEIISAAMALKNGQHIGRFDEDPHTSQLDAISSAMSGERPALLICPNLQKELELVVREIKYLTSRLGFSPAQICCVSRSALIREQLLGRLASAGLKAIHYRADGVGDDDAVLISTLHSTKGHEFRSVFILGLYEGMLPHYSATDVEEIEREAALLYVAMTRAKELLYLSYSIGDKHGRPLKESRFLRDMWNFLDILDFRPPPARSPTS